MKWLASSLYEHYTPLVMLFALVLTSCYMAPKKVVDWPSEEGVVINSDTGEPIADVYVIGHWRGHVGAQTVCFHAKGTRSGNGGRFVFPAWRNEGKFNQTTDPYYTNRSYKRGYRENWGKVSRIQMVPFKGTREERLAYLSAVAGSSCNHAGASKRNMYPFFKAIYLEAKELSKTQEELEKLKNFRYWAAQQAIAVDGDATGNASEYEAKIKRFLEEHLR